MTGQEWIFPASFGQERIWLSHQLSPASPAHNLAPRVRLTLPLTEAQLRTALEHIVARHEALRTSFRMTNDGLTQVVHAVVPTSWDAHDLRDLPTDQREDRALRLATELAGVPIQPDRAPLWRAQPCRLADDQWLLTFVVQHTVFDAASVEVFARELRAVGGALLAGREPQLPDLGIQYPDYAVWERGQLAQRQDQIVYWHQQLADLPRVHAVPTDRPRPANFEMACGQVDFALPAGLLERVGQVGRALSASPFMVLLAGYVALLSRLSHAHDVVVGVPVAGRERLEVADLIGMFVNEVAIRGDCSGEPSFADLVGRIRTTMLDAIENAQAPFQLVVQDVLKEREAAVHPLYQIQFNFIPETSFGQVPHSAAPHELTLEFGSRTGRLLYRTALFDRATAEAMVERYFRLLTAALNDPTQAVADLPLLSGTERHRMLVEWSNATVADPPTGTIHGLIEEQVRRTPHAVAVDFGGVRLTYAELNARANRVAHRLTAGGIGPGTVLGVCAPNSADLIIGVLGVLKSGAAYVPLDPDSPARRQALLLSDSGAALVLTTGDVAVDAETLALDDPTQWADSPATNPEPTAGPGDLAYVIYTSGSTGRPKGVPVEHRAVVAYLAWTGEYYPSLAGRALLHTSPSFDLTLTTLFGALVAGGSVVDGSGGRPSFLTATPGHLAVLTDESYPTEDVTVTGEALVGEAVQPWRERYPDTVVTNGYGPTEATIICIVHRIEPGTAPVSGPVPIGRPIPGTQVYVLDDRLQPVPPGVSGQLYLAGAQLARGYLGLPELTAQRFPQCPFAAPGERMYATGDLARWRRDSTLEYLGRIDDQIKLRGYRIEPGEVEAALRDLPGVRDVAVAVRGDTLVGYVCGTADGAAEALRATLPEYMVPTVFVTLDVLPIATSGKLDRAALPVPRFDSQVEYVAPRGAAEELVAGVLGDLLGVDKLGVHDDFFARGGNSLLAIRAMARIGTQIDLDLPVRSLFSFTTVAALAVEIERRLAEELDRLSDDEVRRQLVQSEQA